MTLFEVYESGGRKALAALAKAAGTDTTYLYQLATGWRGKRPSPDLCKRLIAADPRLSYEDLLDHERLRSTEAA